MPLLAIAKANKLEIDFVETDPSKGLSEDYLRLNKLAQIPTFVGSDGFILTESVAIAIYRE